MKNARLRKRILYSIVILFLVLNLLSAFHAYRFTHFSASTISKTNPNHLPFTEKIMVLISGIKNPRPVNTTFPLQSHRIIKLQSNKNIECWHIRNENSKGTVILFHGYGGTKSSMLDKANEFIELGYTTFLVDFMGSGGSEGNQTTIGYYEAEEVKSCFEYVKSEGEKNIILFGTSLGAVAITKSIQDYSLSPSCIILECPFGSMYKTTCARFNALNVPSFPMAGLLVFWGGVENNFWAFGHNPSEYVKSISCPTLLIYGEKDDRVSREETDEIFQNLIGEKKLLLFPEAGHENYLIQYKKEWKEAVSKFLSDNDFNQIKR